MAINVGNVRILDNSKLVKQASRQAIERALEAIGLSAQRHAASICPVDTGNLRNSISHKVDVGDNAVYIGSDVNSDVFYAGYVELGTYKMAARPYIKPAATEHTAEYKEIAKKYLSDA